MKIDRFICFLIVFLLFINLGAVSIVYGSEFLVSVYNVKCEDLYGTSDGKSEVKFSVDKLGAYENNVLVDMAVYQDNKLKLRIPTNLINVDSKATTFEGQVNLEYYDKYSLKVFERKLVNSKKVMISSGKAFFAGELITIKVLDLNGKIYYLDEKKRNPDGSFVFDFEIIDNDLIETYIINISGNERNKPYEKRFYLNQKASKGITVKNHNISNILDMPITELNSSEYIRSYAEVVNQTGEMQEACMIAALYDSNNNKLIATYFGERKDIPNNSEQNLSVQFILPELFEGYYMKVFIIDNLNVLKPLSLSKELAFNKEDILINSYDYVSESTNIKKFDFEVGQFSALPQNIHITNIEEINNCINLSFSPVNGATLYKIFISDNKDDRNGIFITDSNVNTDINFDLSKFNNYEKYLYVIAYDGLKRIGRSDVFLADGKIISGTVYLPNDDVSNESDTKVYIYAWTDNGTPSDWNDDYYFDTYVIIPKGNHLTSYRFVARQNNQDTGYYVRYFTNSNNFVNGFYNEFYTVNNESLANRVDISKSNQFNIDLHLLK